MFLKDRQGSSFGCFVFDFCVLRFRVLGASFSRFACFVFEIWVLRASVFVFESTAEIEPDFRHLRRKHECKHKRKYIIFGLPKGVLP